MSWQLGGGAEGGEGGGGEGGKGGGKGGGGEGGGEGDGGGEGGGGDGGGGDGGSGQQPVNRRNTQTSQIPPRVEGSSKKNVPHVPRHSLPMMVVSSHVQSPLRSMVWHPPPQIAPVSPHGGGLDGGTGGALGGSK